MQGGVFQTERLTLRFVTMADKSAIVEALADWDVARWLTRVPYPYSLEDAETFITANHGKSNVWAIADAAGFAGIVGMQREFGYWLARHAWGQGYATEMGRAVLARHFADPAAMPVISGHVMGNDRSARVLQKLGFAVTGHQMGGTARGDQVLLRRMLLSRSPNPCSP
jgi:RimJ/RimL family protein N-acetyltransferase